jgi:tRNA pseudouridine13 synthase
MLADWVNDQVPKNDLTPIPLRLGEVPMPRRLSKELRATVRDLALPLHSARNHLDDADPRKPYFDRVLTEEEVTLDQFKLKGFRALFFSKGDRAAWCFPTDLEARDARDEENPRKKKLTMHFDLPRGSYATLVMKRISRVTEPEA